MKELTLYIHIHIHIHIHVHIRIHMYIVAFRMSLTSTREVELQPSLMDRRNPTSWTTARNGKDMYHMDRREILDG